jgi:hypothetical protein
MDETISRAKVTGLIPMAFVASVQRSIDFYNCWEWIFAAV